MIRLLTVLFLFPLYAKASLPSLAIEFLESNSMIKSTKFDIELARLTFSSNEDKRPWLLQGGASKLQNDKDQSLFSTISPFSSTSGNIELRKSFLWGGDFSLNNKFSKTSIETGNIEFYTFEQSFSFSQAIGANFLGRLNRLENDILSDNYELSKVRSISEINSNLLTFIEAYYEVVLRKMRGEISKKALKRNKVITKLVKRRVRDGLREKVDLYLARNSEVGSIEEIRNNDEETSLSLRRLSSLLHRSVKLNEINTIELKKRSYRNVPSGNIDSSAQIILLEKEVDLATKRFKQADKGVLPEVNFNAKYSTNDINSEGREAIREGIIGSKRDELSLGINFSMPLGFKEKKNIRARSNIAKMKADLNLKTGRFSLKEQERILKNQISLTDTSIKSGSERLKLAKKTLSEYKKLYKKGRSTIDQVISAEGALSDLQLTLASYYIKRERAIFSLHNIYGNLNEVFLKR